MLKKLHRWDIIAKKIWEEKLQMQRRHTAGEL